MSELRSSFEGKRILVTGGAGAIGSNLCAALAELGAHVVILDDLSSAEQWAVPSSQNLLFVEGSITDEVMLKRVFFERPELVFHLAAFFANQNSVDHPEHDLEVNGLGTLRLLEYSVLAGVDRFVFASSGCSIYGSEAPLPLREEFMSMHLSSPYQITKMVGELYCNFFWHHYGLKIAKPRFFNSYGPGELPGQYRNVIPNFIYRALKGLPLLITGDGNETRDFTYVGDIVEGLLLVCEEAAIGEAFNLAAGREVTIRSLADMVNEATGNDAGVKLVPRRKWDTKRRLLASIEKAHDTIGYEPKMPFEEGLTRTVEWFRDHWEQIDTPGRFGPGVSSAVREMTTLPPGPGARGVEHSR